MTAKNLLKGLLAVVVIVAIVVSIQQVTQKPQDALRLVINPAIDEVTTKERYQPFVEYLEEEMGVPIEIVTVTDYTAVVEAMKYGHADLARFGSSNYIVAAKEVALEPLIVGVLEKTGEAGYFSYIISRPDLEDLDGATFAFVDPGSSSGFLYPNNHIEEAGIQLGRIMYAGSHPAVIEAVKNGSVDAGATACNRWSFALQEGVIVEGELKIFWSSTLIPNAPWVVQADMDEGLKEAFVTAMLGASEELVLSLGNGESEFVTVTDADYDIVRAITE